MPPDTAPAAQPSNDAPADANAGLTPNDISYEMTEAEEQAFVNETLGIKGAKDASVPEDKPTDPTPPVDPVAPAPEADKPADPVTPEVAAPEVPAPAVPEAPVAPAPTVTADIAAPQTDDLWIEVQDSEGKDVKLTFNPNDPASFLPDDFTFKNDKQLMDIMEAKAEMANLYKDRVSDYETKTAEQQDAEKATNTQAEQTAAWDAEIQDLIAGGLLDTPKITDATDPKFLEDPAVAKVDAVFKFMTAENLTRTEAGLPLLRSFGTAFNLLNAQEAKAAEEDKTKKENELAKARGALVGGASAPGTGTAAPVYKAGSAHSIYDVKIPDA